MSIHTSQPSSADAIAAENQLEYERNYLRFLRNTDFVVQVAEAIEGTIRTLMELKEILQTTGDSQQDGAKVLDKFVIKIDDLLPGAKVVEEQCRIAAKSIERGILAGEKYPAALVQTSKSESKLVKHLDDTIELLQAPSQLAFFPLEVATPGAVAKYIEHLELVFTELSKFPACNITEIEQFPTDLEHTSCEALSKVFPLAQFARNYVKEKLNWHEPPEIAQFESELPEQTADLAAEIKGFRMSFGREVKTLHDLLERVVVPTSLVPGADEEDPPAFFSRERFAMARKVLDPENIQRDTARGIRDTQLYVNLDASISRAYNSASRKMQALELRLATERLLIFDVRESLEELASVLYSLFASYTRMVFRIPHSLGKIVEGKSVELVTKSAKYIGTYLENQEESTQKTVHEATTNLRDQMQKIIDDLKHRHEGATAQFNDMRSMRIELGVEFSQALDGVLTYITEQCYGVIADQKEAPMVEEAPEPEEDVDHAVQVRKKQLKVLKNSFVEDFEDVIDSYNKKIEEKDEAYEAQEQKYEKKLKTKNLGCLFIFVLFLAMAGGVGFFAFDKYYRAPELDISGIETQIDRVKALVTRGPVGGDTSMPESFDMRRKEASAIVTALLESRNRWKDYRAGDLEQIDSKLSAAAQNVFIAHFLSGEWEEARDVATSVSKYSNAGSAKLVMMSFLEIDQEKLLSSGIGRIEGSPSDVWNRKDEDVATLGAPLLDAFSAAQESKDVDTIAKTITGIEGSLYAVLSVADNLDSEASADFYKQFLMLQSVVRGMSASQAAAVKDDELLNASAAERFVTGGDYFDFLLLVNRAYQCRVGKDSRAVSPFFLQWLRLLILKSEDRFLAYTIIDEHFAEIHEMAARLSASKPALGYTWYVEYFLDRARRSSEDQREAIVRAMMEDSVVDLRKSGMIDFQNQHFRREFARFWFPISSIDSVDTPWIKCLAGAGMYFDYGLDVPTVRDREGGLRSHARSLIENLRDTLPEENYQEYLHTIIDEESNPESGHAENIVSLIRLLPRGD
ncbi:MAG: hypothetical protein NUW37_16600 [Planctomycetes bacterium]|nr:hypothetical protein [Planctomycetota bacterium]